MQSAIENKFVTFRLYNNDYYYYYKKSAVQGWERVIHPISPKTPAPHYQPIDIKKRKGKIVKDYSSDRAAYANKEALLALLLKPANPTPSNTG